MWEKERLGCSAVSPTLVVKSITLDVQRRLSLAWQNWELVFVFVFIFVGVSRLHLQQYLKRVALMERMFCILPCLSLSLSLINGSESHPLLVFYSVT